MSVRSPFPTQPGRLIRTTLPGDIPGTDGASWLFGASAVSAPTLENGGSDDGSSDGGSSIATTHSCGIVSTDATAALFSLATVDWSPDVDATRLPEQPPTLISIPQSRPARLLGLWSFLTSC